MQSAVLLQGTLRGAAEQFSRVLELVLLCCKATEAAHQTAQMGEELSVCHRTVSRASCLPSFPALGLTYDEVISFVPPPLDQEEMES